MSHLPVLFGFLLEFVKSGRYAQLPTEAEKLEAEKTLKEAEEAELKTEDSTEDAAEKEMEMDTDIAYSFLYAERLPLSHIS